MQKLVCVIGQVHDGQWVCGFVISQCFFNVFPHPAGVVQELFFNVSLVAVLGYFDASPELLSGFTVDLCLAWLKCCCPLSQECSHISSNPWLLVWESFKHLHGSSGLCAEMYAAQNCPCFLFQVRFICKQVLVSFVETVFSHGVLFSVHTCTVLTMGFELQICGELGSDSVKHCQIIRVVLWHCFKSTVDVSVNLIKHYFLFLESSHFYRI